MRRLPGLLRDDRAISAAVTHVLALGITAILISGLLLSAGTVLEDQRENSAREELLTIGNRISAELARASALAEDGGEISIRTRHPTRVGGQSYDVTLLTGSDCDTRLFDTEACLSLEMQDGGTSVMVPVRNETDVALIETAAGSFSISAVPDESTSTPSVPTIEQDLRVGVGKDLGGYDSGSIVNATNRKPISGFTFTPGQPTVDSTIQFENDTEDLDGVISTYEWELCDQEDGSCLTKTGREIDHSFADPGKKKVTLTVTDDDGETANVSKIVSVGGLVFGDPDEISADDRVGDSTAESVSFNVTNEHDGEVEIREVLVDPANDTVDRIYAGSDSEIQIDGDVEAGGYNDDADVHPGGQIFDLASTYGPGGEGYAVLPGSSDPDSHAEVQVNGFRAGGSEADMGINEPVVVTMRYEVDGQFFTSRFDLFDGSWNAPPDAAFEVDGCSGGVCNYDGSSSNDDGSIVDYEWNFGDGNGTSGASASTPSHTYSSNGSYTVSLTVTDDGGKTSTTTRAVVVGDLPIVVWAVNAGGDTETVGGTKYEADYPPGCDPSRWWCDDTTHPFFAGPQNQDRNSGDPVAGGEDDLYQSFRYGDFGYDVPVANGDYEVTFEFAEVWVSNPGQRQFDVKLEGTEVITDYDIYDEVGHDVATRETRSISVSDGTLDVDFETDAGAARLNAMVIEQTDAVAYLEDENVSGRVVVEAENYMNVVPGNQQDPSEDDMNDRQWETYTDGSASEDVAVEAAPDYGKSADNSKNGERLDYYVDVTNPGTYDVYVRVDCPGFTSSGVNVGLDGTMEGGQGNWGMLSDGTGFGADYCWDSGWTWASHDGSGQVTVEFDEPGTYTFNLWMRDDGVQVDKIVLKQSGNAPTGEGPDETATG